MEARRLFQLSHFWSAAAAVVVISGSVHLAQATCRTDSNGVVCCGRVYVSSGFCCWAVACSDGSSDSGCGECLQARLGNGIQKDGAPKNHIANNDLSFLLARLLKQDKEISRALRSMR
jgi:hypothetical protein